jgi:hypothetical protein
VCCSNKRYKGNEEHILVILNCTGQLNQNDGWMDAALTPILRLVVRIFI